MAWSGARGLLSRAPATSLALPSCTRVRGAAFPGRMEAGASGEGSKLGQAAAWDPVRSTQGRCGERREGDRAPKDKLSEEERGGPERLRTETALLPTLSLVWFSHSRALLKAFSKLFA